jgi:hypothetical protein
MSDTPAPRGPGPDEDPPGGPAGPGDRPWLGSPDWTLVPQSPDWPEWMGEDAQAGEEDPGDPDEEYEDPDNAPPPGLGDAELAALLAAAREVTAEQARAAQGWARLGHTAVLAAVGAVCAGRRGPGLPGSAETVPGEVASPAAGFGSGQPLDAAPGCAALGLFLEDAAGADDRYAGASDDELAGVICAWDRVEAYAGAGKHAAVAELIRRRPAPGAVAAGPAQMPEGVDEFAARELGAVLGIAPGEAGQVLDLAWHLQVNLPGTRAGFRAGILSRDKAAVIAAATVLLDPAEARAAEAMVLGRAGPLTPDALRAAIRRAVMEVNPGKAKKRREHAARRTRVERWAEDSGNGGLAGRELPPAQVLAADQRATARARQLRQAGLDGDMDQLRARAFLDILLGTDSRPPASSPDGTHGHHHDGRDGNGQDRTRGRNGNGQDGARGQDGSGRDADSGTSPGRSPGPGAGGPGPPPPGRPSFTLTRTDQPGPPGGYGTWRLSTGIPGQRDLLIQIGPIPAGECDHRHQAKGHDPGVLLRHLAQVRHATCTGPGCRRPAATCDFEHNVPYEAGGRTCLCNGNPKCRRDHRMKQDPRWTAEQLPSGEVRWTMPSGRQYITEPTRYPI